MPKEVGTISRRGKKATSSHPLQAYTDVDDVPITMHPSPLSSMAFKSNVDEWLIKRMETKLVNFLSDANSPCIGQYMKRKELGECPEEVFDSYMSKTMEAGLLEPSPTINGDNEEEVVDNIIYIFSYPNFPSFGDTDTWGRKYKIINQSNVLAHLKARGAKCRSTYFENKPYRCISSKLIVSYDTQTELYYAHMSHWVQSKDEDGWTESF